jgi:iron complex outermembrane receptor protein
VKGFFVMTAVVLLATGVVWAQGQTPAVHTLDEILVTATHETRVIDTPSSISIITGEELIEMGAKDITEALSKIPGVDNTSAKSSSVTIRGNRSAMAGGPVILIDGIPQKIGDSQYNEFSFIPVSEIERIEVLRSAGITYGPGAARGVINIITKRADKEKPFRANISASYGSWDTHDENVGFSGQKNAWDYAVNFGNYSTNGYEEEETDRQSVLFKVGYNFSENTRLGARYNYIDSDSTSAYGFKKADYQLDHYRRDIHFPVSADDPTLWWHTEKDQEENTLALEFSHRSDDLFIDANAAWTGYSEDYRDLHYLKVKETSVYYDDKDQDAYAFNISGGYNFDFGNVSYTPSVGITYEDISFDQDRRYPYSTTKNTDKYVFDVDEKQYGLFWDNDFLFGDTWGLKIGGRVDKVEVDFEDKVPQKVDEDETLYSWQIAPSYHLSDKANLYFSIGRNYWFPTPRYYAWAAERGGDLNPPEDLKPEETLTYEIGYKHMVNNALNINLTLYYAEYKDKFGTARDEELNNLGQKNIGDAEAKGIEIELDGRPWELLGYRFAGTWQDIEWTSGQILAYEHPSNAKIMEDLDGYEIYDIPEYSFSAGLDVYPLDGLKCSVDVNYTGSKYVDYINRIDYDARTTVDANISYSIKNWQFWVLGKNIFDEKIERVSNSTGKLNTDGTYANAYYVQDGAYFEAGVSYHY